ncbi:CotH kinase family protein [Parvicella tangerina]|uniref:Bacterial repeat domain-containing protein n=1 Tax=Parvicella tangerina TaxID=2829795 RepID=A0A916JNF5_9FLAO|nr:CotH kinase family protein [Parvicella tangerina]CAG5083355.1 hypothetical protein CRYO30217_02172 [Parvicella tangerina]
MRYLLFILSLSYLSILGQVNPDLFNDRYPESGMYATELKIVPKEGEKVYYSTTGSLETDDIHWISSELIVDDTKSYLFRIKSDEIDTIIHRSYHFDYYSKLPIISISINPEDLWNDTTGIYVKGKYAYWSDSTGHWENCNYQKKWEKEVFATYIDTNNTVGFSQRCGLKLFGESTRRQPDKSMKLIARGEYGNNRFSYPIFSQKPMQEYKQLAIRTSGNDYNGSRFKDVLSAHLARNIGIDYMAFQPANLFVNGEYWGVYNLREKVNEHFIAGNYEVDDDSVNIIMGRWVRQEGSSEDYMKMYYWFESLDTMDHEAFEIAKQFLDLRNYINFRVFQIYINNKDSRGNIRYFNISGAQPQFKMILYDTDLGYGKYSWNFLEGCMSRTLTGWYNPTWSTMYLTKLMQHPEFKNDFVTQFAHLMNTVFERDSMLASIEYLENIYKDELPKSSSDRPAHLKKVIFPTEKWMDDVNSLKSYAKLRPKVMWTHLQEVLNLDDTYWLTFVNDSSSSGGMISINDNYPLALNFKGRYFKNIPLTIKAIPDSGYHFIGWNDNDTNSSYQLLTDKDTIMLYPKFEKNKLPATASEKPIEVSNKNTAIQGDYFTQFISEYEVLLTWISLIIMAVGILLLVLYFILK